jgi:DNA-binding Lrp family transcriptional regulator
MLRSQDILALLKVSVLGPGWTFDQVAHELGMSASAVHRSIERAERSGLYSRAQKEVIRPALLEFLRHGLRYVFPPEWAGEVRGTPTAWAAPPLVGELSLSGKNPPVWPDPHGKSRGIALAPIDPRVPDACRRDEKLRDLLALIDAIRIGGARERDLAAKHLEARLLSREDR